MPSEPTRGSCDIAREELVACLLRSDCVLKSGKSPTECLKNREQLPLRCQHLISSFADCKKGMLDMRRRFRGNHLSDKEAKSARGSGIIGVNDLGPVDEES